MSSLRQRLRHPGTYLAVLALALAAVSADGFRPPPDQLFGRIYVALVHSYQGLGNPALAGYVQCRFQPTCSRYSVAAVQKYGLRKGLVLTSNRLWRCRRSVSLGTVDPVP